MSRHDQASLEALAAAVGQLLLANGERLATAESCTGGWLGQCLTAVAGSSAWFERGFITYSNDAKIELLGVTADTLAAHGAVSEATAMAMAHLTGMTLVATTVAMAFGASVHPFTNSPASTKNNTISRAAVTGTPILNGFLCEQWKQ